MDFFGFLHLREDFCRKTTQLENLFKNEDGQNQWQIFLKMTDSFRD